MGSLHALWNEHRKAVDFLVAYIREAHPEDGWVVTMNRHEDIRVRDPETDDERVEVAASCVLHLAIEMPVVVDGVDDTVARAYGALPDRLYLIGRGGWVAFQGEPGPFGFDPKALEGAILEERARLGI